eukprot:gnl/TRDRNA2_/TRDRNA2_43921_c0_seq1.p1 gnl/TRDRNA2_/TRDRNA2_43921_c0~~gnl/TRDRNA2_/TRDRNA2_43921_c0_seq1.p1  ORF type:complete len:242 (+),score=44.25 gnl/TRDRNA2_/TRDRNA2_43921_c0_seq1:106-831(+)
MPVNDEEELADLISRVKSLQRESQEGKAQWWAWCDCQGFTTRKDPSKHTTDFLRRFFDARREGRIPMQQARLCPAGEDPEMHATLVHRIKQSQRQSQEMKNRWWSYCDSHCNGIRDPQRHSVLALKRFLDEFASDLSGGGPMGQVAWPPPGGGMMPPQPMGAWDPQHAAWHAWQQQAAMQGGMPPPPGLGQWPSPPMMGGEQGFRPPQQDEPEPVVKRRFREKSRSRSRARKKRKSRSPSL